MNRSMEGFRNFEDAEIAERKTALLRTPEERILLLHKLVQAWSKFPRLNSGSDTTSGLSRRKPYAGKS